MDKTLQKNAQEYPVSIKAGSTLLKGNLGVPEGAYGVVVFASGNGSNRESCRNRYIAQVLRKARWSTLLVELLTSEEEAINLRSRYYFRFNIGLLAKRLVDVTQWLLENPATQNLNIGYFGTNTGSAAALVAAANRPDVVRAIVSNCGRPDMAGSALFRVQAPTLLIARENEIPAIAMNKDVLSRLPTQKQLEIIPGASHSFEQPGAIEEMVWLANQWFNRYLKPAVQQGSSLPSENKHSTIEC